MKSAGIAILTTTLAVVLGGATVYLWLQNQRLKTEVIAARTALLEREQKDEVDRTKSERNACLNCLRILDSAKQQWALEENKRNQDEPKISDLIPFMVGGVPRCPSGGAYTIGQVSVLPRCSIAEHELTAR